MTQEPQHITIGEKTYESNSLTEAARAIITDLQRIDALIETQKLAVSTSTVARDFIFAKLEAESVNFTEIETEEEIEPGS